MDNPTMDMKDTDPDEDLVVVLCGGEMLVLTFWGTEGGAAGGGCPAVACFEDAASAAHLIGDRTLDTMAEMGELRAA